MNKKYFEWLLERVDCDDRGYDQLLYFLYTTQFYCKLSRDQNRIDDAKNLQDEYDGDVTEFHPFVSVLEVLIALAMRMDDQYTGDPDDPHPEETFWELIENLRLDDFSDKDFDIREVGEIVNNWLDRQFQPDGEGSIFPIVRPKTDQRKIEMWSQMLEYLSENY